MRPHKVLRAGKTVPVRRAMSHSVYDLFMSSGGCQALRESRQASGLQHIVRLCTWIAGPSRTLSASVDCWTRCEPGGGGGVHHSTGADHHSDKMHTAQQHAAAGVRPARAIIRPAQQRGFVQRRRPLSRSASSCRAAAGVQFGVHANVWEGSWTPEEAKRAIAGTAAAGYDLIEGEPIFKRPSPTLTLLRIMAS